MCYYFARYEIELLTACLEKGFVNGGGENKNMVIVTITNLSGETARIIVFFSVNVCLNVWIERAGFKK